MAHATVPQPADPAPTVTVQLAIGGMTCAACAARIEKVLGRTPGVVRAAVNLPLETAQVEAGAQIDTQALIAAVEATGFTAEPRASSWEEERRRQDQQDARARAEESTTLALLVVSAIATAPLVAGMVGSTVGLSIMPPAWAQAALATFVQVLVGQRFYMGAYKALRSGGANMDVLVVLGTTAAYLYSLVLTVQSWPGDPGHLYFEASAVILTLILFGKLLEARAKRTTTAAVRALTQLRPLTAHRLRDGQLETVSVEALFHGDQVVVKPGERMPVDGRVIGGESELDESLVTGESLPVAKAPGDEVIGGTINGSGALTVEATALGADSKLSAIIRLVEHAQSAKAPVQKLVDRVSAVFVPIVVTIAVATFAGWWLSGASLDATVGAAVAVLVIACPCALGLATPTALVAERERRHARAYSSATSRRWRSHTMSTPPSSTRPAR